MSIVRGCQLFEEWVEHGLQIEGQFRFDNSPKLPAL